MRAMRRVFRHPTHPRRYRLLFPIWLAFLIGSTNFAGPGCCQDSTGGFQFQAADKESDPMVHGRTNFNTAAGATDAFTCTSVDFERIGSLVIAPLAALKAGKLTSITLDIRFQDLPTGSPFITLVLTPTDTPAPFGPTDLQDNGSLKIPFDKVADPLTKYSLAQAIESKLKANLKYADRAKNFEISATLGFGQSTADPKKPDHSDTTKNKYILNFAKWKDVKATALPAPDTTIAKSCNSIPSFLEKVVISGGADFLVDTSSYGNPDSATKPFRSARVQEGMTLGFNYDQKAAKACAELRYDMIVDQEDGVEVDWKLRIVDSQNQTVAYVRVFPRWLSQGTASVVEKDVQIIPVDPIQSANKILGALQSSKYAYSLDRQGSEVRPLAPEALTAVRRSTDRMGGCATRVDPSIERY